jgi:sodium transport system permease protein
MSTPGRPKGESFERQREESPMSTPGRPKGESFERQREESPISTPGRPKGESFARKREGSPISGVLTVFVKELRDAVRDRRSWIIALTLSMLAGPVVFLLLSNFISGLEERLAEREVVIEAPARAPTLVNYLQRIGAKVVEAPPDYAERLRSGSLQNAVVRPPADFEERLARGETVEVEVVYDESHEKAQPVVATSLRLVESFNRELGGQRLLARGVSPKLLAALQVQNVNLASTQARGARLLFIVPWAALIVSVVGALSVAIDVTAGERERGSLEPLLANPVDAWRLVVGKWAVVMVYSTAIVALTMAGFVVSMRFVTNETLSALVQLQWREVWLFAAVLLPFAALMAALNMLVAVFGRSFKEAQTYVSYLSMAVQFSALVPVFLTVRDATWHLWVPSVAQLTVLLKVLRGEPIGSIHLLLPALVCLAAAAGCLWLQARLLRRESIVFSRG